MIHDRKPLMRQVGPVGAEEAALAVFVLERLEAARGYPAVLHGEPAKIAGGGRGWQRQHQPVGLVEKSHGSITRSYRGNRHAFAIRGGSEIQRNLRHAVLYEADDDGGLAGDLVVLVVDRDAENVVLDVD